MILYPPYWWVSIKSEFWYLLVRKFLIALSSILYFFGFEQNLLKFIVIKALLPFFMICWLLQTNSDFDAKPMVMLLGQYSTGKTTFIKHLLQSSYPGKYLSLSLSLKWTIHLLYLMYFLILNRSSHRAGADHWQICSCYGIYKIILPFLTFFSRNWWKLSQWLLDFCFLPLVVAASYPIVSYILITRNLGL